MYLIKFLDLILGILMAEPTKLDPVTKIPLQLLETRTTNTYHPAPKMENVREIATPT